LDLKLNFTANLKHLEKNEHNQQQSKTAPNPIKKLKANLNSPRYKNTLHQKIASKPQRLRKNKPQLKLAK
jgi:hypothetical protein